MATQIDTEQREAVLVEDAHIRPVMGLNILEPLPSSRIPYAMVDLFILVHEAVVRITREQAGKDTKHQHRGFDNLWYAISGSSSTGHSTGPGGAMERARLEPGSLLKLRTGRGVWHAEGIGQDELEEGREGTEMRGLLFWVNLARRDKGVEPSAQLLQPQDVPVRQDGDAIVRVLVGEGSPVELGTPGLILDVELPKAGGFTSPIPSGFNAFVYVLEARPPSAPTDDAQAARRLRFSDRVVRSPWRKRTPGRGSYSWPGSPTARRLSSTDHSWISPQEAVAALVPKGRPSSPEEVETVPGPGLKRAERAARFRKRKPGRPSLLIAE